MLLALWFANSYDQDSGLRLEMLFFMFQVNLTLFISSMFQHCFKPFQFNSSDCM